MSPKPRHPRDRFMAHVVVDTASGCWHWQGALNSHGYGRFWMSDDRANVGAHRAAYELLVGPIPDGMTLDHVCHTRDADCVGGPCMHRSCVNPEHLEPVTMRENVLRGDTPAARNAAKTECDHGHAFDETNTYRYADGRRACRTCIRNIARERMRRVRAPLR